jgi:hypothetical protein
MPYHLVRPAPVAQQSPLHGPTHGKPLCGVVVAMPPGDHAHLPPGRGADACRRELDDALAMSNLAHSRMVTPEQSHLIRGRSKAHRDRVSALSGHHDRHAKTLCRPEVARATPRLRTSASPTRIGERLVAGEQGAVRQTGGQSHAPEQHDDHDPVEHTLDRNLMRDAAHALKTRRGSQCCARRTKKCRLNGPFIRQAAELAHRLHGTSGCD